MISGATRGAGGSALGSHLASAEINEAVFVGPARGLIAHGIEDRIAELTRLGSHARTATPIYHLHADPPVGRAFSEQERADYWTRLEKELGFMGQPFASAIHIKNGREHEHRAYLRSRPNGTSIRLDHDYARREKIDRVTEYERGEPLTRGAHNRAVIAALDAERPEIAAAMRAAGLHEGARPVARLTPTERLQQDRTKILKSDVAGATAAAWARSHDGQDFAAALAEQGLHLAMGDSSPVVVDATGNTHAVARMLSMAAKASKCDAPKAAAINERLGGIDLPTVAEATAAQRLVGAAPGPSMVKAALGVTADLAPLAPDRGQPTPGATVQASTAKTAQPAFEQAAGAATAAASRDAISGGKTAAAQTTGGADARQNSGGGVASLEDVGDGPAPLKPNATPDERAKYLAALSAYDDRKAAAWAAWVRSQDARKPAAATTHSGGGQHDSVIQETKPDDTVRAFAQLIEELRNSWQRAASTREIRRAIERFEADSARIRESAAAGRDDGAAGDESKADDWHNTGNARAGGDSGRDARRADAAAEPRRTEPNSGNPGGLDRDSREPDSVRAAARKNFENAAAAARLEGGLAAQPDAMARLRATTATLQADPFEGLKGQVRFQAMAIAREGLYANYTEQRETRRNERREHWRAVIAEQRNAADALCGAVKDAGRHAGRDVRAQSWAASKTQRSETVAVLKSQPKPATFDEWLTARGRADPTARAVAAATAEQRERKAAVAARLADDRSRISVILATHPHPDAADLDPQTRANRYAGALSEGYRERRDAAQTAQAAALDALAKRGTGTRLLVMCGISTAEQKRAEAAVARALTLTEMADAQQPTPAQYKEVRADGAAHAYAAQRDARAWEARPEVAQALEQARLNRAVDAAAASGDTAVTRALKAGDPDAARAVILAREEKVRRAEDELERRQGLHRSPGRPGEPGAGGTPGPRGPR